MNIEDIRPAHIQGVFNDMPPESKQDTKNKVKNVLNQIFKMAVEDELILRNPMLSSSLKIKGADATVTEPYSVEDMRYFASHLMDIISPMDRAWMALSICLPLRSEEVLGLRWMDVDDDPCLIHVRSTITHPTRNDAVFTSYTKTASSRRELVPPKQIFSYLPDRSRDEDFVIGGAIPVTYTRLRKMRERIARQIGYDGSITPRRFRTTVATDISDCTHDLKLVQKTLGHATPQMTLKHYDKGRSTSADASDAIAACYGLF
jgi:integrase